MSRTYKDKPSKLKFPQYTDRWIKVPYTAIRKDYYTGEFVEYEATAYMEKRGGPKKPKKVITNWNWLRSTPSWWVREFMTVPKRAAVRNWAKQLNLDTIEETDCPDCGNKPYVYYW